MHPQTPFRFFLGFVIALGGAIMIAALVIEGPVALLGPRPDLFLTFSGLLLLAESRPVMWLRRKQGAVITAAPSFNAALLFLAPGLGAAVASGLLSAIGDATCGRPPIKTAFNAAMMTITMTVTSMVLVLSGDRIALVDGAPVTPRWLLVVALALIAYNVVNDVQVSTIIALSENLPILRAIRKDIIRNLQTDGVLLALGPVMVLVAVRSMLLLPVLLAVTIIVLNTTRVALQRLHEATHDPLTGLPNRRLFDEHLGELLAARRRQVPVVVMAVDLDRFKEINDTLGHDVGDRVLSAVADRIQGAVPQSGLVARLGGDEFAVIITEHQDLDAPAALGAAIHQAFTGSLQDVGLPLTIGGSVGVALRDEETTVSQLMRRADIAMYRAKSSGGGVHIHTEEGGQNVRTGRLALVDQLRPAIEEEQLLLHYQPVVDALTRDVLGVEALIRWNHPELGMVPPDSFIPTAEQTDLIEPLTTWVLQRALQDLRTFEELGHELGMSVNLSSRSITDLGFPRHVERLLAEAGVAPSRLTLELTENTILGDAERSTQVLAELRELGVRLALDDFGTGYSSLSNLRDLPLDVVKVDKSFVLKMADQPEDEAIVTMVLQLGRRLGLRTVAEGVEDEQVAQRLLELGTTHLQGFHIARPAPFESVATWLDDRERRPTTHLKRRTSRAADARAAASARPPTEVTPS